MADEISTNANTEEKNYLIRTKTLKDIANAIRLKTDTNNKIIVSQFASMIRSIKDGMKLNYINFIFSKEEPEDKTKYWVKINEPNNVLIRGENSDNCEVELQDTNFAENLTDLMAVNVNDIIYIFGIVKPNSSTDTNYAYSMLTYDTSTGNITKVYTDYKELPKGMACAVVGSKIYIFGGEQSDDDYVSYIKTIDTENNNEVTTVSELLAPMTGMSAAVIGTNIYLAGGKLNNGDNDECYDKIYCFNTLDNSLKKISNCTIPRKLWRMQACAAPNGRIYLFGGLTIDDLANEVIYKFNPNAKENETVLKPLSQSLPDFLQANGLRCISARSKIYMFGNQYSGQFYELNTLSDHFKAYKSLGQILYNSGIAYSSTYNTIYVFGGLQPIESTDSDVSTNSISTYADDTSSTPTTGTTEDSNTNKDNTTTDPDTSGGTSADDKAPEVETEKVFNGFFKVIFREMSVINNDVLITTDSYADQQLVLTSDRLKIYEGISELYFGDKENHGVTAEIYKYNNSTNQWEILEYYTQVED